MASRATGWMRGAWRERAMVAGAALSLMVVLASVGGGVGTSAQGMPGTPVPPVVDPDSAMDSDGDGLTDAYELWLGTDPWLNDTDDDWSYDGDEVLVWGTNPFVMDTDGDLLPDGDETWLLFDWAKVGLDLPPTRLGNPLMADTDGDGLTDWQEGGEAYWDWFFNGDVSRLAHPETWAGPPSSAFHRDTDGDQLNDPEDAAPRVPDRDGDGLLDGEELWWAYSDPDMADTDNDGLSDRDEYLTYGTNPRDVDTDDDGLSDWVEVLYGEDPLS